jgi:hypothetical protein
MRSTLDIGDDILQAAREIAARDGQTLGLVLSELARRGLRGGVPAGKAVGTRGGVPLLPPRREVITLDRVQQLMDAEGI